MDVPDVRYARAGGVAIAYQVVGNRPLDLVAGSGFGFEERSGDELKGVPGTWRLYAVADG